MINVLLIITIALLAVMVYTILIMVKTGRIRAKGAKKRRRILLPFIYKKKSSKMAMG
jgi:hypothetical protein